MSPALDNRLQASAHRAAATRTETLAPPNEQPLEMAVLGAMLLERDAVGTALTLLHGNAEIFYPAAHQRIFRAIAELHGQGQGVDILTVCAFLRHAGQLDQVGGAAYVAELTSRVNSSAHLEGHCVVLLELFTKRRIGEVGYALRSRAFDPMNDAHELLAEAQGLLNSLHDTLQLRRAQTVGDRFDEAVDQIVAASQAKGGITGVPSGLRVLDKVTGGWQPGDLVIIAARPGMGKTSISLAMANMAEEAANTLPVLGNAGPGFFASLEMGASQLVKKVIATELGYTTSQLTKGAGLHLEEAESIRARAGKSRRSRLLLDDTPGMSIAEFRAKITKAVQEHGVKFGVVDYLQLMSGDPKHRGNREQEIASIARGLKLTAKELQIPILALCQLSRAVETRGGDKKPQLSDLRESGAIEQDADLVIFPYRAEYYGVEQDADGNSTAGLTEIIIAKHRNGATASVMVKSNMATGKYEDLDADKPYEVPASSFRALPASDFDTNPPF